MNSAGAGNFIDKKAIQPLLNWFFPRICLICNQPIPESKNYVCESCWSAISPAVNSHLKSLWLKRAAGADVYFSGYHSCFLFNDSVQKIIHSLKYEKIKNIVGEIAKKAVPPMLENSEITSSDYIIPVPLHKKKLKERGFNQSAVFTREVSKYLHIPCKENCLLRKRYTQTQTKLDAEERRINVSNAFDVKNGEEISNCKILLVDDLITTGSTINECAKVLLAAGARSVFALSIAHPA